MNINPISVLRASKVHSASFSAGKRHYLDSKNDSFEYSDRASKKESMSVPKKAAAVLMLAASILTGAENAEAARKNITPAQRETINRLKGSKTQQSARTAPAPNVQPVTAEISDSAVLNIQDRTKNISHIKAADYPASLHSKAGRDDTVWNGAGAKTGKQITQNQGYGKYDQEARIPHPDITSNVKSLALEYFKAQYPNLPAGDIDKLAAADAEAKVYGTGASFHADLGTGRHLHNVEDSYALEKHLNRIGKGKKSYAELETEQKTREAVYSEAKKQLGDNITFESLQGMQFNGKQLEAKQITTVLYDKTVQDIDKHAKTAPKSFSNVVDYNVSRPTYTHTEQLKERRNLVRENVFSDLLAMPNASSELHSAVNDSMEKLDTEMQKGLQDPNRNWSNPEGQKISWGKRLDEKGTIAKTTSNILKSLNPYNLSGSELELNFWANETAYAALDVYGNVGFEDAVSPALGGDMSGLQNFIEKTLLNGQKLPDELASKLSSAIAKGWKSGNPPRDAKGNWTIRKSGTNPAPEEKHERGKTKIQQALKGLSSKEAQEIGRQILLDYDRNFETRKKAAQAL